MACYDLCLNALSMPSLLHYKPNRISLNGKRNYVCSNFPNVPEGIVLPSVTTIASACSPPGKIAALMNWRKKVGDEEANRRTRSAVERGNWLHGVLEDFWNGEDIETHLDSHPLFVPYFDAIGEFLATVDRPLLVESAIAWYDHAQEIGYSGTFDMLAMMANGNIALLDWKTSFKRKPDSQLGDYRMQLGAYVQAIEQIYNIEINEAHCAISIYDPEKEDNASDLQVVSLDQTELALQAGIMVQKTQQYFFEHYPSGRPLTISMDRGA